MAQEARYSRSGWIESILLMPSSRLDVTIPTAIRPTPYLQAYRARGISVYRTDRDGGVWVTGRRSQPALQIHRMDEERIKPLSLGDCSWACEQANWERVLHRWMELS